MRTLCVVCNSNYSPLAEAPYNPHSTQRRREIVIFSVSDSARSFSSINHEWSCIPAFVCFYVSVVFFSFLFFLPALQTQSHSAPWTAEVTGAGGQRITDVRFPEGSCGRSRNRTRRLNSEATFSHAFWKVAPIYTVPTVRPPDIGLP